MRPCGVRVRTGTSFLAGTLDSPNSGEASEERGAKVSEERRAQRRRSEERGERAARSEASEERGARSEASE